jgi:hypothetical protein
MWELCDPGRSGRTHQTMPIKKNYSEWFKKIKKNLSGAYNSVLRRQHLFTTVRCV